MEKNRFYNQNLYVQCIQLLKVEHCQRTVVDRGQRRGNTHKLAAPTKNQASDTGRRKAE
jgi:hypothetical protein